MKSVLISIQPKWCELIANGKKTVEVRKTKPKLKPPFMCYIYCTKPREKIFYHGEYYKDLLYKDFWSGELVCGCTMDDALNGKGGTLYGWHISDLKIYDEPQELSEFEGLRKTKFGYEPIEIKKASQSWCYVEEVKSL